MKNISIKLSDINYTEVERKIKSNDNIGVVFKYEGAINVSQHLEITIVKDFNSLCKAFITLNDLDDRKICASFKKAVFVSDLKDVFVIQGFNDSISLGFYRESDNLVCIDTYCSSVGSEKSLTDCNNGRLSYLAEKCEIVEFCIKNNCEENLGYKESLRQCDIVDEFLDTYTYDDALEIFRGYKPEVQRNRVQSIDCNSCQSVFYDC